MCIPLLCHMNKVMFSCFHVFMFSVSGSAWNHRESPSLLGEINTRNSEGSWPCVPKQLTPKVSNAREIEECLTEEPPNHSASPCPGTLPHHIHTPVLPPSPPPPDRITFQWQHQKVTTLDNIAACLPEEPCDYQQYLVFSIYQLTTTKVIQVSENLQGHVNVGP